MRTFLLETIIVVQCSIIMSLLYIIYGCCSSVYITAVCLWSTLLFAVCVEAVDCKHFDLFAFLFVMSISISAFALFRVNNELSVGYMDSCMSVCMCTCLSELMAECMCTISVFHFQLTQLANNIDNVTQK